MYTYMYKYIYLRERMYVCSMRLHVGENANVCTRYVSVYAVNGLTKVF